MANIRFIASQDIIFPDYFRPKDAISEFCRTEHFGFLADRFGYLNQFSKYRAAAISRDEFPNGNSSKALNDIMLDRASYFSNYCMKENKKCYIMYSGGCDSSAIISAFLESGYDLSFLIVLYTKSSIEEFPELFSLLLKRKINLQLVKFEDLITTAHELAKCENIVLTGFPADQLFGSVIGQTYPKDTSKTHWTEYLKSDIANQQYESAFQHYGLKVNTIAEFLWFNNFALKWDYVCYPALWMNNIHHKNIIPFYNTKYFEEWSVSNYDILHKYDQKDYKNYKIQMKDFIYKTTGIKDVYSLKKIPSFGYAQRIDGETHKRQYKISLLNDEEIIESIDIPKQNNKNIMELYGFYCIRLMKKYLKSN